MITFASLMVLWFIVSVVRVKSRITHEGIFGHSWNDSMLDNIFDFMGIVIGGVTIFVILIFLIIIFLP
jgi:hypothetical protein